MRNISVAAVQFEHAPGDKEANLSKVRGFVKEAARQGVEIICLPECCLSGYWHLRHLSRSQLEALAEPVFGGPCCQEISSLSTEYNVTIGAGLIELADEGSLYNTYLIAMPNGDCRRHRKIHAFISKYVSSGSEFTVFETPHECRVGVLTCYDNNIGENVRITALKGAEILLAPHQTGGCGSINPHTMGKVDRALWDNRERNPEAIEAELRGPKGREWLMRWLPTRAHDNGLFLVFSNGVGIDDDEIRTGNAMIIDPYGRILAETWKAGDDMVIANLDASLLEESTGKRWIKTRRPELYNLLTVRTGIEEDTRAVRFNHKGL
ncbi:nitrilase family protein [Acidobacteria bacterium AH-259-O06]|nr:nitrilase family protein [Acidobacteria bacterium AH-259-O06]